MIKSATSKLLLFAAAIALAGCQLDPILELDAQQPCKDVSTIIEDGKEICKRDSQAECIEKHNPKLAKPTQKEFEGVFTYDLCPLDFTCDVEAHACKYTTPCKIGETKCKDGKQLECSPNESKKNEWVATDKNCASSCQEGDTKCIQGNIHTCTSEGNWSDEVTTECRESGCSEGSIQPASSPLQCFECGSDEAKCNGNDLVTCNNHQLSKEVCKNGCMQTESNAYCRECKDDELKCENGFIVSCTKDGNRIGKWDDDNKRSCGDNGCFPGARGNADDVKCYECNTDKPKCFRDENTKVETIKNCLAHNWYKDEDCEFGCSEGTEAVCKECDKDKYFNNENDQCVKHECHRGKIEERTTADVSCNKEMTGKGECLNGTPRCKDDNLQICTEGYWINYGACNSENPCELLNGKSCYQSIIGIWCNNGQFQACGNHAPCKSDSSGCAECQSGTSKCENGELFECINEEYVKRPCSTGTHCEIAGGQAQCVEHDCENGTQRCEGNIIQACENYQWKTKNACGDGEQCVEKNGFVGCSCTSATAYCDNTQAMNCIDGQWQSTTCNAGACSVVAGIAKCIECESGTKCQDETKIMTCQNNAWSAATSCADGMKCTGDTGSAKCVCKEGQAKCASDNTKIIKCKADGTYGSAESCGEDKHCEGVAGSAVCTSDAMECSPGEKRCNGDDLQTCNSKGKWEKTQTCEKGCANMACNVCTGNEKICENSSLKTCENGQWKITYCGYGCYDKTQCNVCPKGIKQCSKNTLQTCLGNKWEEEECQDKCITIENYNATCNCIVGSVECVAPKNAKVCNQNGEWKSKSCPGGCVNNVCRECQADAEKCEDGNHFTCSGNGEWIAEKCDYGCNEETGKCYPECKPGSKKCYNNSSYTCDNNGNWPNTPKPCVTGCNQQTGECIVCIDGEKQCKDNANVGTMQYCLFNEWHNLRCGNSTNTCNNNECTNCKSICLPIVNGLKKYYYSIPCKDNTLDVLSYSECSDYQCKICGI